MARIIHRQDPSGIENPIVYNVPTGTNVLAWLSETFSDSSDLCGDLACSFVMNGKVLFSNDDENGDEQSLNFNLGEYDDVVIVNRPADPVTQATIAIIIAVVSVAVAVLTYLSLKDLPGAEESASSSPNNLLNAAQNEFRPYEGIPECFGYGVSYPDFIQPSYYYYESNIKIVVGLFCVTVGEIEDDPVIRVGDTNIDLIPRSTATLFGPGEEPDSEYLTIHQTSTEVDGQVTVAPNDDSLIQSVSGRSMSGDGVTTTLSLSAELVDDIGLSETGYIYLRLAYDVEELNPDYDPLDPESEEYITVTYYFNGVFEIDSITGDGSTQTITFASSFNDTQSVYGSVGRGYEDGVVGEGTSGELDYWIGWYEVPGDEVEEVWINWRADSGIRASGGGTITIKLYMEIESLDDNDDPTGNVWSQTVSISENTYDAQFRTTTFTKDNFPGMPAAGYRARVRRLTNVIDSDGNASEEIKLELFESVTPYTDHNFGDVTLLLVERKATLYSADQSGKKINLDYKRKLPTYNRETDEYDTTTLTATNSFMDAAAYTLIVAGYEDAANVDLAEGYALYDGLSDSQLGGFAFTFDDADLSMGERVESICNVARTIGYHDGKQWRFIREEAKPIRSAMFNRRSLSGNNAQQAWIPQRDDDSDSVRIIYVDDDDNTEAYIERKFNLVSNEIISGEVGNVINEINLAGCRNAYQAINRADLEIRRLAYQRRTVTDTTYREALELDLLDRVDWVDINDTEIFDGEIMGINGDIYDTTERFIPEDGEAYVVYITDNEGYPSNTVECLARDDTEFGFVASGISGAYVASGDQQIGSRYMIANASDLIASEFTLKSRTPNDDGTVEVELIEYRSEMFEMDDAGTPEDAPIINTGLLANNIEQSGTDSISTLTLNSNGTMTVGEDLALWYSGGATANVGDSFEAKVTVASGATPSGTIDEWVTIGDGVSWSVTQSGDGFTSAVITLQIRQIEYNDNSATNNITIQAVVAEAVGMDATIDCYSVANNTSVLLRIDFESDGTWSTSCGDSGTYTTIADEVGSKYEIQVTNVVGDALEGNDTDEWITLNGSGAYWSILSYDGAESSFDVEVREIADTGNTASTSVTLYGTVSSAITLPVSITVDESGTSPVTASVTFEDDGAYSLSDGGSGVFSALSGPLGNRFEIQASNLVGDTVSGPSFSTWHTIETTDIEWYLESTIDESATFDVEIREIYNTSNTDTVSVTLSTEITL